MKTRLILTVVAAAFFATTTASAWNLSQCSATDLTKRSSYSSKLRHALPEDRAYVPKPFPENNAQVIEDFNYQFRFLRSVQTPAQMRPQEKQLLSLLNSNHLTTDVIPVENWSGRRCLGPRDGDRMYLLRFYDARTHAEVARATLQDSGLMDVTAYREPNVQPAWWTIPIPAADDVAKTVGALVGEHLINAQYVTTYGTFECDALLPCVAMRAPSTNTTYIADQLGHVVTLPTNAKRFSRAHDLAQIEDMDRVKRTLAPGQKLLSLGGDAYAVVEKIK
jgi:hypothetical protein